MLRGNNPKQNRVSSSFPEPVHEEEEGATNPDHENENTNPNRKSSSKHDDVPEELLGFTKMEYFKQQCRSILGPSTKS